MAGICWLASYPKSGNTWLRAFLANLFSGPKPAERPVPINELSRYCLADDFISDYARHAGRDAAELSNADFLRLRPAVQQGFAEASKDTVFVKTHNAAVQVEGVPLITPAATAGAIYIVRDPRDVAVSYAHHFQIPTARAVAQLCDPNNILPAGDGLMRRYLGSWSGHLHSWTRAPGLRLHVVRYEDMALSPYDTFAGIVRFLGLPPDPPRIERAIEFSSFDRLKKQETEAGFEDARPDGKSPFFRAGKAGSWREVLGAEDLARILTAHGEAMAEFGYRPETSTAGLNG